MSLCRTDPDHREVRRGPNSEIGKVCTFSRHAEIEMIFLSSFVEFESVCSVGECAPSLQCRGVQDDVPVQVWGSLCGEGHTLSVWSL